MSTPNIAGLDDANQPAEVLRKSREVALKSTDNNNDFYAVLGGGEVENFADRVPFPVLSTPISNLIVVAILIVLLVYGERFNVVLKQGVVGGALTLVLLDLYLGMTLPDIVRF